MMHDLYVHVGKSGASKDKARGYSAYRPMVVATGKYGVQYNPEDDYEYTPWEIPEWALAFANRIQILVVHAESIGCERGYDNGLASGKSFVRQLASGKMAMKDFDSADDRNDRRLNRKKW